MIVRKSFFLLAITKLSQSMRLTKFKDHQKKFNQQFFHQFANKFSYSSSNQSFFVFSLQNQPQLLHQQLQYRSQQNIDVFKESIKSSTCILDQIDIFRMFKVMQSSPFSLEAYEQFFDFVNHFVQRKSDNMLILLATIKQKMAKHYKQENDIQSSLGLFQDALQILQHCMVPQLLPYYSIYRQYGLLYNDIGDHQKSKQILTESVNCLESFVNHSDDNALTNQYCKKQATAYNVLAKIDEQESEKWIEKALQIWERYTENKYSEIEYAKTVANNLQRQLKENKEKGQSYYHFNLYKFQKQEMKDVLNKTISQSEI